MANISNSKDNTLVYGTGGDDYISNGGNKVSIETGGGNDTIYNMGASVSIDAGDGNDKFFNSGKGTYGRSDYVTIYGGAGDDTIYGSYNYISINGGSGNDSIENRGVSVSIDADEGNDTINIFVVSSTSYDSYGKYALIKYTEGDGNDYISGFNSTSTLSIGNGYGTYCTETVGSDLVLTVGEGKITLSGTAKLSNLNILGQEEFIKWRINGTTATYGTSNNAIITINGVKSLDGISLNGNVVTVAESVLNKKRKLQSAATATRLSLPTTFRNLQTQRRYGVSKARPQLINQREQQQVTLSQPTASR
jgi:Ca2+-binding RTX toxin-like protein